MAIGAIGFRGDEHDGARWDRCGADSEDGEQARREDARMDPLFRPARRATRLTVSRGSESLGSASQARTIVTTPMQ